MPEFHKQGIGNELIREGLIACRQSGHDSVIVLEHPDYYLRFVFRPAGEWGIKGFFGAPAEAFMALELEMGALEGASGVDKHPEEFNDLEE